MLLALWLEHTYTKDQILTAYLNRVYLGSGAYGVDAAARTYFNKPAHDLNIREAAIIAGLLRAPSRFSPMHDPALAMERGKVVLQAMVEEGYITDAQRRTAIASVSPPAHKPGSGGDGHYYADWVYDQIGPMIADTEQDVTVKTTLDLPLQRMAEHHVDAMLDKQGTARNVSEAALITVAPDGAVRALVGGRDYHQSQYNRVTQAMRQPGSAFKPIVYLAAIEQGLSPDEVIPDAPLTIGGYSPENYEGKYLGNITVRQALAESINTVAVRVLERAGVSKVIDTAHDLGITSPLEHDAALALGASEVTPLELTTAYAALASGGKAVTPYAIEEIDSREGQVLFRHNDVTPPQAGRCRSRCDINRHDGRGREIRHRQSRRARWTSGRRQNRHDIRLPRRLVRRIHSRLHNSRLDGQRRQLADETRYRRFPTRAIVARLHDRRRARRARARPQIRQRHSTNNQRRRSRNRRCVESVWEFYRQRSGRKK